MREKRETSTYRCSALRKGADAPLYVRNDLFPKAQVEPGEGKVTVEMLTDPLSGNQSKRAGVRLGDCATLIWSHKVTSPLGLPPKPLHPSLLIKKASDKTQWRGRP